MPNIKLKVLDERLGRDFPLPSYETEGSAGMDLRAMLDEDYLLKPDEVKLVSAGFSMHIADRGIVASIYPRSGLGSKNGIVLGNLTGIIDSDYQGPIMMPVWNRSDKPFVLEVGMRIAQMVFTPVLRVNFELCEEFEASSRGEKGFGSTGS